MILHDVRFALRLMQKSPGFTAVVVISLALGIGANTAIFSLINAIMLRQMPVERPDQLVAFVQKRPGEDRSDDYIEWSSYEHFRDNNHVFSALTGVSFDNIASVRADDTETDTVVLEKVVGNYFHVLGLKPALGRLIAPEDVPADGVAQVAVLSWSYWNSRFHRDPAVIGKRIFVQDRPVMVIGIAPAAYTGPRVGARTDMWVPSGRDPVRMLGRLKVGVTLEQARAEMALLYRFTLQQRAAQDKDPRIWQTTIEVEKAGAGFGHVREKYGKPLAMLMVVVALLLLLACSNVASLLLARASARQREMAIRVAVGGSLGRLTRQMLTESLTLASVGALVGSVIAYFGTGLLVRILASGPVAENLKIEVQPDLHLLLFTAFVTVLAAVIFGLAPAWYAFRNASATSLRHAGKGGDRSGRQFEHSLVSVQVALSVLLVSAATMFVGHVSRMRTLDLGFRSDNVLLMILDTSKTDFKRAQLAPRLQQLQEKMRRITGVQSVAIGGCTPIQGCGAMRFVIVDERPEPEETRIRVSLNFVSPGYFETLRVPFKAGRDFSMQDVGRPRVAIINEAMAGHYFPGGDAVGKYFRVDPDKRFGGWNGEEPYEVIGVVANSKNVDLHAPAPRSMFFNMFQENEVMTQFLLRTAVDPDSIAGPARQAVREELSTARVLRVTTLSRQVDSAIVPERLVATLASYFGLLAIALSGIGLYGLLSYTVARRTGEIGVRIAIGASAVDIWWLVLRRALIVLCGGILAGGLLAFWARPLASSVVQALRPESLLPIAFAAGAVFVVGLLACVVPVRRAARVDPIVALRTE
ncbi:MAG: putative transport system permease protein [Thermoleophilales bacterium]|nr:putative transport system permease protein [Thermoleophilales bacterium]